MLSSREKPWRGKKKNFLAGVEAEPRAKSPRIGPPFSRIRRRSLGFVSEASSTRGPSGTVSLGTASFGRGSSFGSGLQFQSPLSLPVPISVLPTIPFPWQSSNSDFYSDLEFNFNSNSNLFLKALSRGFPTRDLAAPEESELSLPKTAPSNRSRPSGKAKNKPESAETWIEAFYQSARFRLLRTEIPGREIGIKRELPRIEEPAKRTVSQGSSQSSRFTGKSLCGSEAWTTPQSEHAKGRKAGLLTPREFIPKGNRSDKITRRGPVSREKEPKAFKATGSRAPANNEPWVGIKARTDGSGGRAQRCFSRIRSDRILSPRNIAPRGFEGHGIRFRGTRLPSPKPPSDFPLGKAPASFPSGLSFLLMTISRAQTSFGPSSNPGGIFLSGAGVCSSGCPFIDKAAAMAPWINQGKRFYSRLQAACFIGNPTNIGHVPTLLNCSKKSKALMPWLSLSLSGSLLLRGIQFQFKERTHKKAGARSLESRAQSVKPLLFFGRAGA